jgi:hypothetical protein
VNPDGWVSIVDRHQDMINVSGCKATRSVTRPCVQPSPPPPGIAVQCSASIGALAVSRPPLDLDRRLELWWRAGSDRVAVVADLRGREDLVVAQVTAIRDCTMPKRNTGRRGHEGVDIAP